MKASKWVLPAILLVSGAALAQSPLAGTWKLDPAKSKLTGETMKFTPADNGAVQLTESGRSYTFKPDGTEAMTPFGRTAAWTKESDNTWKEVVKNGDTTLATDTYKLSDDGKTLTVTSTGTRPDGTDFNDTEIFRRIAGGNGLMGTWRSEKLNETTETVYEFTDDGSGGIVWHLPQYKASVTLSTDGKEAAPTGPTVPQDLTLSLTKSGPRSFVVVEKYKGQPVWKATMTVSADGHTLTSKGSAPGVNEPTTAVYEKQ